MNDILILTLLNIPQLSRKIINAIIKKNNKEDMRYENIVDLIRQAKSINSRINIPTNEELTKYKEDAENIVKVSKLNGIGNITILDEDFPERLKNIEDAPVILFYKGNKECILENKSVAIIGTRNPTHCGEEIAEKLGAIFGSQGFVVTSGLAKGCDEFGHKGCVGVAGRSIAVLPGGLDKVYPASNKTLANLILENKGCLVSEYPIGKRPFKSSFVERDRLQSALSQAVIVVETDVVGGTMHTVGYTLQQKRILVCYNHPKEHLDFKQTRGNQKLIREKKAIGIYSKNDIEKLKKLVEEKASSIIKEELPVVVIQQKLF